MLTEITINNVATYSTPAQLTNLKKINFIFGANGSGKTTISRVLDQAITHTSCSLKWEAGIPIRTLVYNQDFVDRNFNQSIQLKGVFTLGDDQVEAERQIAELQKKLDKQKDDIKRLNIRLEGDNNQKGKFSEIETLDSEFQDKCWKIKLKYDEDFKEAFSGLRGSAAKFKERVLLEKQKNISNLLSLEDLKEKALTIFSKNIEKHELIPTFDGSFLLQTESHKILQKNIIGNQDIDIAKLIEKIGNIDWVKQGLQHFEKSSPHCPFCQQSTPPNITVELNQFFNGIYDQEVQIVEKLCNEYENISNRVNNHLNIIFEKNSPFIDSKVFQQEIQILTERIERNKNLLNKKLSEPNQKISLESLKFVIDKLLEIIQEANHKITEHNDIVKNIDSEKETLKEQIWRYIIHTLDTDLNIYIKNKRDLEKTIEGMKNGLKDAKKREEELQLDIKRWEKQATSITPTSNEINHLLKTFGFTSFWIQEVDNTGHYKICRANGDDASRSLSEGEKTFITFLYFYSLIKGSHSPTKINEPKIVVFDDPISSLDSDILYIVSSIIKQTFDEIMKKGNSSSIKQAFVLTHNVYFHKEITFDRVHDNLKHKTYWMVKKNLNGSIVENFTKNPISSAYELLWSDLRGKNPSSLTLQNTLRRILENYFTMWGGMGKDEVCNLFEGREKIICQSLFSWVNDGSHSIHDDLYINHGEQTNESYLKVFKEIFNKSKQLGHYEMMMKDST